MELEVALEPGGLGQAGRVQGLDGREVRAVVGQFLLDGVPRPVAEFVVVLVDPEMGGPGRVGGEQPTEARLDEVVERVVERPAVRTRARGAGGRSAVRRSRDGFLRASAGGRRGRVMGQVALPMAVGASGRGLVSASAARTASIVVSMSAAVTP